MEGEVRRLGSEAVGEISARERETELDETRGCPRRSQRETNLRGSTVQAHCEERRAVEAYHYTSTAETADRR